MGNATTRSLERVAAAMGALESAPVQFQPTCDVTRGGVLLALPALLAVGLLHYTPEMYQLPKGFYGIDSIFLLLGLMALARIQSLEQLRYQAPGEWGKLLGLDRIPEVRTLRAKLKVLCEDLGRALRWNAALAKEWIARQTATELFFYCDGHVRVYHGEQTPLPRHYVARERLCLRATTDYWINAMDGQPFLYVNKEVDPGLIATLQQDVIPWLELTWLRPRSNSDVGTKIPGRIGSPWCSIGRLQPRAVRGTVAETDRRSDLSQVPPASLARGRVPVLSRQPGGRGNREHETGRAREPVVESVLGPRDPQTE